MSDEATILTVEMLNLLIAQQPTNHLPDAVTVSFSDERRIRAYLNDVQPPLLYCSGTRVYIDPTLKRGEFYFGEPDPERLGERFKGYRVGEANDEH